MVRPFSSRHAEASRMQPHSAFHTSGTRPVWRNDASNFVGAALSSATKYQSASLPRLWIHEASGVSVAKSGAMPSAATASAALFAITPFAHTESTRALYGALGDRALPSHPLKPGVRLGHDTLLIFAPAASSSPTFFTHASLIVSVFGRTSSAYETPPGATTRPFSTFSSMNALVAQ